MILQRGLASFPLWQQSILPDMDFMEQAFEVFSMAPWQIPHGVRATRTPSIRVNRLRIKSAFRMGISILLKLLEVKTRVWASQRKTKDL